MIFIRNLPSVTFLILMCWYEIDVNVEFRGNMQASNFLSSQNSSTFFLHLILERTLAFHFVFHKHTYASKITATKSTNKLTFQLKLLQTAKLIS